MKLVRDLSRGVVWRRHLRVLFAAASCPRSSCSSSPQQMEAVSGANLRASVQSRSAASSLPWFSAHAAALPNSRPAPLRAAVFLVQRG